MTPRIALVAWEERAPANYVFVVVPDERGRYVRTDRSVVFAKCGWCGAIPGEPCKNKANGRYSAGTHVDRRNEYQRLRRAGLVDERTTRDVTKGALPEPDPS